MLYMMTSLEAAFLFLFVFLGNCNPFIMQWVLLCGTVHDRCACVCVQCNYCGKIKQSCNNCSLSLPFSNILKRANRAGRVCAEMHWSSGAFYLARPCASFSLLFIPFLLRCFCTEAFS